MKRVFHADCRVEVGPLGDREAFSCDDAEVWIEGEMILVSYFDEEGIVVLEGRIGEAGAIALGARSRPRRATLVPESSNRRSYVGEIEEHGEKASWTLLLGAPVLEPSS